VPPGLEQTFLQAVQQAFVQAAPTVAQARGSFRDSTLSLGRPSQTPLQPDWLSRQCTATPARASTCSRESLRRMRSSS
jgi:hypothetical protein